MDELERLSRFLKNIMGKFPDICRDYVRDPETGMKLFRAMGLRGSQIRSLEPLIYKTAGVEYPICDDPRKYNRLKLGEALHKLHYQDKLPLKEITSLMNFHPLFDYDYLRKVLKEYEAYMKESDFKVSEKHKLEQKQYKVKPWWMFWKRS